MQIDGIKKSSTLKNILQLLAFQIGNEVSYTEIGQKLGLNHTTVQKYIDILEQAFIIIRLRSFSRNLRNEIIKGVKIYFVDLGIRNSLIQNFNPPTLRQDTGSLWENWLIIERQKYLSTHSLPRNTYFWRNTAQAEIDYIEDYAGVLHAYEFKYGEKSAKIPRAFGTSYPDSSFSLINPTNYHHFCL